MAYKLRPPNLVLLWTLSFIPVALCACYAPNGTETTMSEFFACSRPDTICCALGRTNPAGADIAQGFTKDECLPNGLCENRYLEDGEPKQTWWRTFCTDANFSSEKCLDICKTGGTADSNGNKEMTPCDGTRNSKKWCCGTTKDCCTPDNNPDAIILAATMGESSSAPSPTATSSDPPTSSDQPTNTSSSSPTTTGGTGGGGGGLSTGEKAGIGVGAGIGAIALLAAGAFFIVRSRRKSLGPRPVEADGFHITPGVSREHPYQKYTSYGEPVQEEPASLAELPVPTMEQHELPTTR